MAEIRFYCKFMIDENFLIKFFCSSLSIFNHSDINSKLFTFYITLQLLYKMKNYIVLARIYKDFIIIF